MRNISESGTSSPKFVFGEFAYSRIETIGRVKLVIVSRQIFVCMIQMADIVFGRVLCAACVQRFEDFVFDRHRVMRFLDDVVLMKDVAQKVAVIELVDARLIDVVG